LVWPTIALIGGRAYWKIMHAPIPEAIIETILSRQVGKRVMDTKPIIDELSSGRLEWNGSFAKAGLSHGQVAAASRVKGTEGKALLAPYERMLLSYAKHIRLPRDCMGVWDIEGALKVVLALGLESESPCRNAFALAAAFANVKGCIGGMAIMPDPPTRENDAVAALIRARGEGLHKAAEWLANQGKGLLGTKKKGALTLVDAQAHLAKLYDQHLPTAEDLLAL
jgi:hypothetical protein